MLALVTEFAGWVTGIFCNIEPSVEESIPQERDLGTVVEESWWTAKIWGLAPLDFLASISRSMGGMRTTRDTTTPAGRFPNDRLNRRAIFVFVGFCLTSLPSRGFKKLSLNLFESDS